MRTATLVLVLSFSLLASRAVLGAGGGPAPAAKAERATAPHRAGRPATAEERRRYSEREREAGPLEQFEGGRMSDVALILIIVLIVLIIVILI